MKIISFNKENRNEYMNFIKQCKNSWEFRCLENNYFNVGDKEIFLVIEKGLCRKHNIVAYSIVEKDLRYLYKVNFISEIHKNDGNNIYIYDFMVRKESRNTGIGSKLAQYLINEIFIDKNIILQPDGDGHWFWKKFDFQQDNISKKETWVLKRKSYS